MPVVRYRTDKKKAGGNTWWSEKQKYEAVATYLLFGSIAQVARLSGIPEITLRKWKAQPWWADAEQEVKRNTKLELSGKLRKAVELAQLAVEDRLQNGDFVFNPKTGVVERRAVSADTAVKVLDKLIDKQLLLEKSADSVSTVTAEGVSERLAKLADELSKFAKAKDVTSLGHTISKESHVIDVEPQDEAEEVRTEDAGQAPEPVGQAGGAS
jgi:hypothetical protein